MNKQRRGAAFAERAAFTLIELLVVITIIGILALIGLPALKGFGKSNAITAATRQLQDDVALARQRAIADHTTVYMVFLPPINQLGADPRPALTSALGADAARAAIDQLILGQYVSYALFSHRSVGDQPGRPRPRYRGEWKTLPDRMFIAPWKFGSQVVNNVEPFNYPPTTDLFFPYPTADSPVRLPFPYIAFDYLGRVVYHGPNGEVLEGRDAVIPLAQGSLMHERDANGPAWQAVQPVEAPANNSVTTSNHIHIDWLTGRARVERETLQ